MLFWTPGFGELILIFLIVLLLFGGKKLPSLARSIGSGINEFKKGLSGQVEEESDKKEENSPAPESGKKSGKKIG